MYARTKSHTFYSTVFMLIKYIKTNVLRSALFPVSCGIVLWWGMMTFPVQQDTGIYVMWVVLGMWAILLSYILSRYGIWAMNGVLCVAFLWVIVEYIGIRTCIPYGCFTYSDLVWLRFLWTFPYALFVIWPLLVLCIMQFVPKQLPFWQQCLVWWVFLTTLDVFLDPVAVSQWVRSYMDWWIWFGVPWTNYLWWLMTGTISMWCMIYGSNVLRDDSFFIRLGLVFMSMYVVGFIFLIG